MTNADFQRRGKAPHPGDNGRAFGRRTTGNAAIHYAEITLARRRKFRTQQNTSGPDDLMSVLAGQTDTSVVVANVEDLAEWTVWA